jgi:opacity protein-like surface antigen
MTWTRPSFVFARIANQELRHRDREVEGGHNMKLVPLSLMLALAMLAGSSMSAGASASKVRPVRSSLSGTWSGTYGGSYRGTFTLHWKQSGSQLSGTINLSNPRSQPSITGSVHRNAITFGTVGSSAITYSGSVSGKSMSGSYQTPGGSGSWSAHKIS